VDKELIYKIGITLIPGIGHVKAKTLISYCGSAEAVLKKRVQPYLKYQILEPYFLMLLLIKPY